MIITIIENIIKIKIYYFSYYIYLIHYLISKLKNNKNFNIIFMNTYIDITETGAVMLTALITTSIAECLLNN